MHSYPSAGSPEELGFKSLSLEQKHRREDESPQRSIQSRKLLSTGTRHVGRRKILKIGQE